jgi:hypothetical protein
MTTIDHKVERTADKLQQLANRMAGEGGLKAKLAQPLAEDADLIRKMKPSLIAARAKGKAPAAQPPVRDSEPVEGVWGNREATPTMEQASPTGPQLGARPEQPTSGGGPNPWLVVGVALAAGILLAKWIDWRGHAHPRD